MDKLTKKDIPKLFKEVAKVMDENCDTLCEMDAYMGDGDLGLTMKKGFGALEDIFKEINEESLGKYIMKAGLKMASKVPSTMGTLMSSGIMSGGKALVGKDEIGPKEYAEYLTAFTKGVQNRGKCEIGDRTLLDSISLAAKFAVKAAENNESLEKVAKAALEGAREGVERTKDMEPRYGKELVHIAKAKGVKDQGAYAGELMILGYYNFISKNNILM